MLIGPSESSSEQGGTGKDVHRVACGWWLRFGEASRAVVMLYKIAKVGYTAALLLGLTVAGVMVKPLRKRWTIFVKQ